MSSEGLRFKKCRSSERLRFRWGWRLSWALTGAQWRLRWLPAALCYSTHEVAASAGGSGGISDTDGSNL